MLKSIIACVISLGATIATNIILYKSGRNAQATEDAEKIAEATETAAAATEILNQAQSDDSVE